MSSERPTFEIPVTSEDPNKKDAKDTQDKDSTDSPNTKPDLKGKGKDGADDKAKDIDEMVSGGDGPSSGAKARAYSPFVLPHSLLIASAYHSSYADMHDLR